jgi:hypothetical protein
LDAGAEKVMRSPFRKLKPTVVVVRCVPTITPELLMPLGSVVPEVNRSSVENVSAHNGNVVGVVFDAGCAERSSDCAGRKVEVVTLVQPASSAAEARAILRRSEGRKERWRMGGSSPDRDITTDAQFSCGLPLLSLHPPKQ